MRKRSWFLNGLWLALVFICILVPVAIVHMMRADHSQPIVVKQPSPAAAPTAPATEAPSAPATSLPIPPIAAPSADAKIEGIWNATEVKSATVRRRDLQVNGCVLGIECRRASCIVFRVFTSPDNSDPLLLPPGTCQARDMATSMADIIRGMGKDVEIEQ